MEYKYIANLIAMERHKKDLSAVEVCDGLCSSGVFSKIENGSHRGDIHLIIAILQRLGMNGGKAGRYLCRDEYDEMYDRFIILEYIKSRYLVQAEEELNKYRKKHCNNNQLNKQFAEYMEARIAELEGDLNTALKKYEFTVLYTKPKYNEDISYKCVSVYEFFMLANIARLNAELGKNDVAASIYDKLHKYCKSNEFEEWNFVCIYPKLLNEMLMTVYPPENMGNYERRMWLNEIGEALSVLRKTSRLHYVCSLIEKRNMLIDLMGMEPDEQLSIFMADIIKLREKNNITYDLFEWYPYYIDGGFYSAEKMLGERRCLKGITVEKMSDGVCTVETASRILNMKVSAQYNTVTKLFNNIELQGVMCEDILVSDDLETHKMWDVLVQCSQIEDYITAGKVFEKLKKKLDDSIKINQMVLKYKAAELEIQEKDTEYKKNAQIYEQILGFSINKIEDITVFTNIECMIINRFFYWMDRGKEYSQLDIYEKMCEVYQKKNGVMRRAFASECERLLVNCANYEGNAGEYEKSTCHAYQGIALELECERCDALSTLLYCIPWNHVASGKIADSKDIELCEYAYQIAWYLQENQRMQLYRKWIETNRNK